MNIANLVQGVSVFMWILAVGLVILVVVQNWRGRPVKRGVTYIILGFALALILTTISAGLIFINPEERGVVISALAPGGYRQEVLTPGLHFVVPFAENVVRYDISRQNYTMSIVPTEGEITGDDSIACRTQDGQEVFIDASVIYSVDPTQVIQVHITWQDRYNEGLVRATTRGIIRDAVSQYKVSEVVTTYREEMVASITTNLKSIFKNNGIILVEFVLRNIQFSEEYSASVEQKQIAEQAALQAQYVVEQKKAEAQQAIEAAKGQAQAAIELANGQAQARLIEAEAEKQALLYIADALASNPDLLTYQYITKLSPNVQVMFLPSDAPFMFQLPQDLTTTIQ